MARPKIEFDMSKVEALAQIGCTIDEIATVLGVHQNTIDNRLRDDAEFLSYYKRGKDNGKASLRRIQWQKAKEGNPTMLIWLGKQLLNQTDKREVSISADKIAEQLAERLVAAFPEDRDKVADILEGLSVSTTH